LHFWLDRRSRDWFSFIRYDISFSSREFLDRASRALYDFDSTEFEGTLTSTPSRRTSSMSRFVSSFSSLARS